ncbi:preprotein translocase subunit SecG [Flavihumibacter rivuli]|uniref:preprotein translocase subunit SecG n=1 Tax=Flavihumibacter rivuli TaxID=2838156 RepID=UPI001BDE1762|nr:preprotein translocase subunit SecG [Flavihumibacter rivuli]ULQ57895.1 preprotein translocase subunit SecG [Flavihumibacter rivuli]
MVILFLVLVILAAVILGFIILVQNPKGGGLAGNVAGLSNQFMGVKQTTDVLEKGTWIFAAVVALLCLFSALFIPKTKGTEQNLLDQLNTKPAATAPAPAGTNQQPLAPAPAPANK